ncbi:MAG TPA: hypothetical protein VNO86_08920 [Candidatus Binatia bacterium]|nr:hypothetical protein [Candidatus Binatia bacterium]
MQFSLTEAAIEHLRARRRSGRAAERSTVRIISRGGRLRCRFEAEPETGDAIMETSGVLVAVPPGLVPTVDGGTLDVVDSPTGPRLALRRAAAAEPSRGPRPDDHRP